MMECSRIWEEALVVEIFYIREMHGIMITAQILESEYFAPSFRCIPYYLCDTGQITKPLYALVSSSVRKGW